MADKSFPGISVESIFSVPPSEPIPEYPIIDAMRGNVLICDVGLWVSCPNVSIGISRGEIEGVV
jgi:hypothetical protein